MKKKEVHLRQSNIGLVLDSYDDIFSDFDPRSNNERALSMDFLLAAKSAATDKDELIELRLFIPFHKRSMKEELLIRKRLKDHFKHHLELETSFRTKERIRGFIWFFAGALLIFLSTVLYSMEGSFYTFLFIITEPSGWFTIWTGLERMFLHLSNRDNEFAFYEKMSQSIIYFESIK